jgi:tRNA 2-thiocytidine biosynthesis protein TtcA
MISDWERERPGTKAVMLAALQNVVPSHLLDVRVWKALGLESAQDLPEGLVSGAQLVRHSPS